MQVQYLSPLSDLEAELKPLFSNEYMLAFFKYFCDQIASHMWWWRKAKNARYDAEDFLRVFFYSEITGRSIDSASERLNKYFLNKKKGKQKKYADGRKKRTVPHQTEVNKLLRRIGLEKAKAILRACLDYQLQEALRLHLISRKVNVLIDFTEHSYYGKRRDKMIKGTNRGKGTSKMRHYLGFSILSRGTHLFAGLEHVAKGQSKIPAIIKFLEHLISLGFELRYVMIDREFYQAELLTEIKSLKAEVLIPSKSYKKINAMIEEYLKGTGKRIRRYTISSSPGGKSQFSQSLYVLLKTKKGRSLSEVRREFKKGKLTLDDARKLIYAVMTTQKPRGDKSSWASRTSQFYKKRWSIETGFSDLNRMGRRWKSKYDNTRYLDLLVRMLLYNSWKINRAYLTKCRKKGGKTQKWTLQCNQDALEELFLEA
ncbi:MAG: transposase [Candidatus Lokiarchaeota archaeon]|nr:transposase [Candidatus Lokiarchaeota archaeon]MBD3340927.1 transposase [Candidatus Lokiarchaeota archaeon]